MQLEPFLPMRAQGQHMGFGSSDQQMQEQQQMMMRQNGMQQNSGTPTRFMPKPAGFQV